MPINKYDIAVVGAGPAGIMAAIRASQLNKRTLIIEKNNALGRKMLLTGKGRCNVTNTASLESFVEKFGRQGNFLRSAFFKFFNRDLMDFFESGGLHMKAERQGRVFPATDRAHSVLNVLRKSLSEGKVAILYNQRLSDIKKSGDCFKLYLQGRVVEACKVILATGGASYKATGSSGDGFRIAASLGHTITPLLPGLVPLKTKQQWVKQLQGLSLKNVRITFKHDKKKLVSEVGELMFTHFGISGPLVLDLSGRLVANIREGGEIPAAIDLKPGLTSEQLESKLLRELKEKGAMQLNNYLKGLLPKKMIEVFIGLLGLSHCIRLNQINHKQRRSIIYLLKALPLTITGALPLQQAMVTTGGVSTKEINPRTMGSRIVPGLYFAGEIIDGAAPSGGYNLQQAFSTGYLAGEEAAYA